MHNLKSIALAAALACAAVVNAPHVAFADTIYGGETFSTGTQTNANGRPVSASAVFSGSGSTMTVTLYNLELPTSNWASNQLLSGVSFTLINTTPGTQSLLTATGEKITISDNGLYTYFGGAGTDPLVHWDLVTDGTLTTLTGGKPNEMIIGAPNGSNLYVNNGGIDNFNPNVKYSATFTIDVAGLNATSAIYSVAFYFGTGPEYTVIVFDPNLVPVPSTLAMLGTMLVPGLGYFWRRRRNASIAG